MAYEAFVMNWDGIIYPFWHMDVIPRVYGESVMSLEVPLYCCLNCSMYGALYMAVVVGVVY